jgi:hypothetical protein
MTPGGSGDFYLTIFSGCLAHHDRARTADFGKRVVFGIYFYIYCGIYGEI